jgi:hypothetical protein
MTMNTHYQKLTDEQVMHFLDRGHIVIRSCFSRATAKEWTDDAFARLGYDRADRSTWKRAYLHMRPGPRQVEVKEFAPALWEPICDLLGGEEWVRQPYAWRDEFIVNLCEGADRPWEPPSPQVKDWHKDGGTFRHFLNSPELGLLPLVAWSDIAPYGGGTFIACDSVPVVARFLHDHPEGILPDDFPFQSLIARCHDFVEMTAQAGDVLLLHPFLLHTTSQNHLGIPRFITNHPISLREPMQFDRADPADFSLVELAILRGLGVERLDFQPAGPREKVDPWQVVRKQKQGVESRVPTSGGMT